MPILGMQVASTEVGRIRIGGIKPASGKGAGPKLETFRFTSPSRSMIDSVVAVYGGNPVPWVNDGKDEWSVVTAASEVAVQVPEMEASQWFEAWAGGKCTRRCDGRICRFNPASSAETIGGCHCGDSRGNPGFCFPTTRMSFRLLAVHGFGVWRLDTKGWNAAKTLMQPYILLQAAAAQKYFIPAVLRLEQRVRKNADGTFRFAVPVIDILESVENIYNAARGIAEMNPGSSGEIAPAPVAQIQGARTALPPAQPAASKAKQIEPAKPAAGIWSGPGQCPGCHAPEGKRHGAKCTVPPALEPAPELNPGSAPSVDPCELCGRILNCDIECPNHPDYTPEIPGTLIDVPDPSRNMGGAHG